MIDEQKSETDQIPADDAEVGVDASDATDVAPAVPPQYGVGPFSVREIALGAVWLVAFVVSFFPVTTTWVGALSSVQITWGSVWTSGLAWILTIGVPTIAVFLIALRRLSPDGIRRFGSLGVDQFASVAFSVAAIVWLSLVWDTVTIALATGGWVRSWVIWVELVLMLAGVVLTVLAPIIRPFSEDFEHRPETVAHRVARPTRVVVARPAPEPQPVVDDQYAPVDPFAGAAYGTGAAVASDPTLGAPAPVAGDYSAETQWTPEHSRDTFEPVETPADDSPGRHQAFWALAPEERDVVDEVGVPLFRIGPSAWALVIEDRGDTFVVRHEDGRIGFLHDIADVTRG